MSWIEILLLVLLFAIAVDARGIARNLEALKVLWGKDVDDPPEYPNTITEKTGLGSTLLQTLRSINHKLHDMRRNLDRQFPSSDEAHIPTLHDQLRGIDQELQIIRRKLDRLPPHSAEWNPFGDEKG